MGKPLTLSIDLLQYYSLTGQTALNCIEDSQLISPQTILNLSIDNCSADFSIVTSEQTKCSDDVIKYVDPYLTSFPPCKCKI